MWVLIFIFLLSIQVYLVFQYLDRLNNISSISVDQQKELGINIFGDKLSSYFLLRDIKFFISLSKGSYKKCDIEKDLKYQLDQARKYLLLQYPLVIVIFLIPILKKLVG